MKVTMHVLAAAALAMAVTASLRAQSQVVDYGRKLADTLSAETDSKLKLSFEIRARFENRAGNSFGKEPDREYGLSRTRFGMTYTPLKWLRFSGMVQDSRAPFYGPGAPTSLRDRADLHEAYFELMPDSKAGFGFLAGRSMLSYGEGRLIGTPQWSNLSRTYDNARLSWRGVRAKVDLLLLSPVKIRLEEFNRPVLGERIWGVYTSFPNAFGRSQVDFYVLRHDQNRVAGFTGGSRANSTDRLGTNTVGFRLVGPLAPGWKYSLENAWQGGAIGAASQQAAAVFYSVTRHWMLGRHPLDVSGEYKYASGTGDPANSRHSGTFDQLSPANHDKFGHSDLFGWRNLHNARSETTLGLNKRIVAHLLYDHLWLASARDGLYSSAGKVLIRSADGSAGRHVGQELDGFVTCRVGLYQFGAGYGYFFDGGFIRRLTPGASPSYAYVFSSYAF